MNKIIRKIKKFELDFRQKRINKAFEKKGATEKIIKKQVAINKARNKYDIPDSNLKIYEDFVQ